MLTVIQPFRAGITINSPFTAQGDGLPNADEKMPV
jgi:hypothetical protein